MVWELFVSFFCDIKYKNFWSFAHINCTYFKYLECVCAEGEMLHEICHALLLKVFGSPVPHLFLLPSKYLQCGGFARHQHYWAQEENKEKLNIAFQYLKTEHVDFFLAENYFRHFPD